MAERIDYARNVRLPKLAWFARVDLVDHRVAVEHGTAVECNERWMVEGVWDGEYAAGAFHEDAHLFGSSLTQVLRLKKCHATHSKLWFVVIVD
jgi:hypothetical protein